MNHTACQTGVLLCSDLDRTILPNGPQPESPLARPLLRRLARRPEVTIVYVSGRHLALLNAAVAEYDIPRPDYAIGDVGTTIYQSGHNTAWEEWPAWRQEISTDWRGLDGRELASLLSPLLAGWPEIRRQEPEKQNHCKLSYYTPASFDRSGSAAKGDGDAAGAIGQEQAADPGREELLTAIRRRLAQAGLKSRLVWSVDEERQLGLLDVLPAGAGKLAAIRFLMRHLGFTPANTVFAGDSGNDLDVLASELNAVLVANAPAEVRREAMARVKEAGREHSLYCAAGGLLGMNGNYAAGVLEGLAHYQPLIMPFLTADP
ncbi:HAD-IIB family hydrolase [Desulfurivibrio dismutans]|uniref:HAD-IIB family hydrolase n=1 Tax=Desulfurivibrio dismutans TaxID=1398908 RepID=UPI0023DCC678|nr:HAD-IIB family hydrolase [Desulfurivibrio alkaliphilus]MDF1615135.1 HAD-IIB family hydrolase [Desulfurivibrio alkaliphilus]